MGFGEGAEDAFAFGGVGAGEAAGDGEGLRVAGGELAADLSAGDIGIDCGVEIAVTFGF